ncbi:MAG: hypothetical protein ACON5D_19470 [Rubripirellula sp.]
MEPFKFGTESRITIHLNSDPTSKEMERMLRHVQRLVYRDERGRMADQKLDGEENA